MKVLQFLAVIALCAVSANAGRQATQLVRLHEVSREEYDELMRLTEGRSEVEEARLIHSPIAGIKGLTAGYTAGSILPSIFGSSSNKNSNPKKGYPLCVISTQEIPTDEEEKSNSRYGRIISWNNSEKDNSTEVGEHTDSTDETEGRPIVNCIVIVKKPVPEEEGGGEEGEEGECAVKCRDWEKCMCDAKDKCKCVVVKPPPHPHPGPHHPGPHHPGPHHPGPHHPDGHYPGAHYPGGHYPGEHYPGGYPPYGGYPFPPYGYPYPPFYPPPYAHHPPGHKPNPKPKSSRKRTSASYYA